MSVQACGICNTSSLELRKKRPSCLSPHSGLGRSLCLCVFHGDASSGTKSMGVTMIKKMTNGPDISLSGDVSGTSVLETRQKGPWVYTVPSKWEVTHPRSELRGSARSPPQPLQSSASVNIYISVCAKHELGNKQDDWPLQNIAPRLWCWFVPVGFVVNCILYWLRPVDHSEAFYFQCSLRKSMSALCPSGKHLILIVLNFFRSYGSEPTHIIENTQKRNGTKQRCVWEIVNCANAN